MNTFNNNLLSVDIDKYGKVIFKVGINTPIEKIKWILKSFPGWQVNKVDYLPIDLPTIEIENEVEWDDKLM